MVYHNLNRMTCFKFILCKFFQLSKINLHAKLLDKFFVYVGRYGHFRLFDDLLSLYVRRGQGWLLLYRYFYLYWLKNKSHWVIALQFTFFFLSETPGYWPDSPCGVAYHGSDRPGWGGQHQRQLWCAQQY